jgi:hypothetical protein
LSNLKLLLTLRSIWFYILPPELELELIEDSRTKVDPRLKSIKEYLNGVDRYDLKSKDKVLSLSLETMNTLKDLLGL